MDARRERLIRRTAMVAACTGAYLLLTADYGPGDNVLVQVRETWKTTKQSVKKLFPGSDHSRTEETHKEKPKP